MGAGERFLLLAARGAVLPVPIPPPRKWADPEKGRGLGLITGCGLPLLPSSPLFGDEEPPADAPAP